MTNETDFDRLSRIMLDEFRRVHERFDAMDARFDAVDSKTVNITSELAAIHRRLDAFDKALGNVSGFAKEIDHVLKRVAEIEKHLGLTANILA